MKQTFLLAFVSLLISCPMWAQSSEPAPAGERVQVVVLSLNDVKNNHGHLVRIARYNGVRNARPFQAYMKVYEQYIQSPNDRDAMQELVQVQQIVAKYLDGDMSSLFRNSFTKNMSVEEIMPIFRAFF